MSTRDPDPTKKAIICRILIRSSTIQVDQDDLQVGGVVAAAVEGSTVRRVGQQIVIPVLNIQRAQTPGSWGEITVFLIWDFIIELNRSKQKQPQLNAN